MNVKKAKSDRQIKLDLVLLIAAAIWGFAFVAQRVGMDHVGPFTYNGIRFALGALCVLPLIFIFKDKTKKRKSKISNKKIILLGGGLAGTFLFLGSSFQQVGLVYTTAGNAGFITGLYVVIVPVLGIALGHRINRGTWIGIILAAIGLCLLSITEDFSMSKGDLLVLIGAFCWAGQILVIGWLAPKIETMKLAFAEFLACSILSLIIAVAYETIRITDIQAAAVPIIYGGAASVGIAFTIQVFVQKKAHPTHASIIMSMEAVFAALGGWLILGEIFTFRELIGCTLMLVGMLASQLWGIKRMSGKPGKGFSPSGS